MAIEAVTLDAAGTLFRVAHPVGDTYARIAREFEIPVTAAQLNQQFRTLFPRMSPLAFGQCGELELKRQERNWWQTLVRNCLGPQGRHARFADYFDQLYRYYASARAWRLYPEIEAELRRLEALGVPLGVVSNFDSRLEGILETLGISGHFRHIHYSSRSGSAKPHPGIFRQACEMLNVAPAATLHIGDSYPLDLCGAREAGLQALWLDRSAAADSDQCLNSLAGLARRLQTQPLDMP